MTLTATMLVDAIPGLQAQALTPYLGLIREQAAEAHLVSPERLAAFLATLDAADLSADRLAVVIVMACRRWRALDLKSLADGGDFDGILRCLDRPRTLEQIARWETARVAVNALSA